MTVIQTTHPRYTVGGIVKDSDGWHVFLFDEKDKKEMDIRVTHNEFVQWMAQTVFNEWGAMGIVKAEAYIFNQPEWVPDYIRQYTFSKL